MGGVWFIQVDSFDTILTVNQEKPVLKKKKKKIMEVIDTSEKKFFFLIL